MSTSIDRFREVVCFLLSLALKLCACWAIERRVVDPNGCLLRFVFRLFGLVARNGMAPWRYGVGVVLSLAGS